MENPLVNYNLFTNIYTFAYIDKNTRDKTMNLFYSVCITINNNKN